MNYLKPLITTLLAGGLLTFAVSGFAGEEGEMEKADMPAFETVDANLDGKITLTEAKDTWLAKSFTKVDVNQDGVVNRSEYESAIS
jgi:Ca2+-binding EF-hand superfamily protein